MLTWDIREIKPAEAPVLAELGRRTFLEAYGAKTDSAQMQAYLENAFGLAQIQHELQSPTSIFLVAEASDQWLGYAKLRMEKSLPQLASRHAIELQRIYVQGNFQGHGIGKSLMEAVQQRARAAGFDYLWLGVWEENPAAIAFYRKLGFTQNGTHPFDWGGVQERDWVFGIDL